MVGTLGWPHAAVVGVTDEGAALSRTKQPQVRTSESTTMCSVLRRHALALDLQGAFNWGHRCDTAAGGPVLPRARRHGKQYRRINFTTAIEMKVVPITGGILQHG